MITLTSRPSARAALLIVATCSGSASIAPSKSDPDTIYVGTDTGRLWKTTDLGNTWTEFVGKGLPVRWVNAIVVDPTDANHVYVAFSGYREGDESANVWETTDGGDTWQNISGNLPDVPVNSLQLVGKWRAQALGWTEFAMS